MGIRTVCFLLLMGSFVVTASNEVSNDLWNVRAVVIDANAETELEKQFGSVWDELQDPLDWINNVIEADPDDAASKYDGDEHEEEESTEETYDTESEDSFSTSEEYESDEESDDETEDWVDSSEETSEESVDESSDEIDEEDTNVGKAWNRKRAHHTSNRKKIIRPWIKQILRRNQHRHGKFRNPHGAKVQIPHPPATGRWYKVWQKFNRSKPAVAGRWAAMYNRTRNYWNTPRDSLGRRMEPLNHNRNHSHHNHSHPWHHHNRTHHPAHHRLRPHHTPHVHRRVNHHGRPKRRWLEDKAAHVCNYISSARHRRYLRLMTAKQHKKTAVKRDYRMDYVDKMSQCCEQDFEEKLECFGNLTRARIDEFCNSDSNMPFRPWKPGQNPRAIRKIKPKCCLPEGEARYNCFNRTHHVLQKQGYGVMAQETTESEEAQHRIPDRMTSRQLTRQERRTAKKASKVHQKMTTKQRVKARCCSLGKRHGANVEDHITVTCNKIARKVSRKAEENRLICHMAIGRCCINEARNPSHQVKDVTLTPEMELELDALDEMSALEDVEERNVEIAAE